MNKETELGKDDRKSKAWLSEELHVAKRKIAAVERALRKSEKKFLNLAESIIDVLYAIDGGGVITYVSPAIKNVLGYERDELIGRHFTEFVYEEDKSILTQRMSDLRSGIIKPTEYRMIGKQGDIKWVRSLTNPSIERGGFAGAGGLLTDITERKQAEEALRKSESNLRALALELSLVEERERQRLALFLHDEIGQSLSLLRMKFGTLADASTSRAAKKDLRKARDLLKNVINQIHTLTFELSPPVLHQLGLEAAIDWAGEKISHDHGIEFTFNDDGVAKSLNPDLQVILFRCVRELMLNTVKHAKAKRLTVASAREGENILFTIADDGLGFDPSLHDAQAEKTGFGLLSVREHLATMGGNCRIQSTPGQGTRITLTVPVGGRRREARHAE